MFNENVQTRKIERRRTAIVRRGLSRPVRLALEAALFAGDATFFDYGCGHGVDVRLISARGYVSGGWDPYYFPESEIRSADIVNLGYVINVIECQQERRAALLEAWARAKGVDSSRARFASGTRQRRPALQRWPYYQSQHISEVLRAAGTQKLH